jgi:ribosome-binding factor A
MTRKRLARRHGRGAPDSVPDLDSIPPETSPDALVDDYFGPVGHTSGRRTRGRARDAERSIGPLRREIERTLTYALAAARDPWLRDLVILGVDPAPDGSCFQVTVAAPEPLTPEAHAALAASLDAARGELRSELARSLQRKRTPELRFAIGTPEVPVALELEEDEP